MSPARGSTRRDFAGLLAATGAVLTFVGRLGQAQVRNAIYRLNARPGTPAEIARPGLHRLGLRSERDALFYVPEAAAQFTKAPLIVSLHGATRGPERGIDLLRTLADEHGFLLLAPASEGTTWDAITDQWGTDAVFINQALMKAFSLYPADGARVAMAGFSDGASCSLSLGLSNGDFFSAVFGFSPGFVLRDERWGKPPVYISHGTADQVLPIEQCSRMIVPALKREGYKVTFREFDGKHTLPPEVAAEAMKWFMAIGD